MSRFGLRRRDETPVVDLQRSQTRCASASWC